MIAPPGDDWTIFKVEFSLFERSGTPREGSIGFFCMPALSTELGEIHPQLFGTITFPDVGEFDIDFYPKWRHSPYHSFKDTQKEELESLWSV